VFGRADYVTFVCAIALHACFVVAVTLGRSGEAPRRPPSVPLLLQYAPRPATPAVPPPVAALADAPVAPPAPRVRPPTVRKLAVRSRPSPEPVSAPPPEVAPAPEPPPSKVAAAPAVPAFGVSMTSTTEVSAPDAPVAQIGDGAGSPSGQSGASRAGRPGGSPALAGAAGGAEGAVSDLDVGVMPEVDGDACGRAAQYPHEAEANGIEGDVRLRVSLNERGTVRGVQVLSGPGHGLDQAAAEAIRHRCRFSPAVGKNGRTVAFVIESYTFHFELPR
jgi:protein TonB